MKLGNRPLEKKDTQSILKELKGDIKNKKDRLELLKKSRELHDKYNFFFGNLRYFKVK